MMFRVPGEQVFCQNLEKLVFVAAGGNGGEIDIPNDGYPIGTAPVYPAAETVDSVDNLLGVGASTRLDKLASFTTMGNGSLNGGNRWVKAVAPGEDIVSAIPGGRYGMWSGSSMAAPVAAGIAALVKAKNPNMPVGTLVETLENTGYPWNCFRRGSEVKTSRLDALCAVSGTQNCGLPNDRTDVCQ